MVASIRLGASASRPRNAARTRAAYGATRVPVASLTASASATSDAAFAKSPPSVTSLAQDVDADREDLERARIAGELDLAGGHRQQVS